MKKSDIILSLITGEGMALFLIWFLGKEAAKPTIVYLALAVFLPLFALFCLWIAYLIGKKFLAIFQLAKFVLIGAFFALIDLTVLNFLLVRFNATEGAPYVISVTISFIVATCFKYVADKYWAFEKMEKGKAGTEFGAFFIVTLISLGIQVGTAYLVVTGGPKLGLDQYVWANVGKICGIIVAAAWNFVGYKYIVFKK